MNPKYPIYIISKGRSESRLTSKALEEMNVPYHIVIEPQQYDEYAAVIDPAKILVLPFSNLGCSSPARNWCWEHSISLGARRHWIMDDNIRAFFRLNNNMKTRTGSGKIFRAAEDFVDRYTNVPLSGFNYDFFCVASEGRPPFNINTRIYSCLLIENSCRHRWRLKYNEDVDLSLLVLKDGDCTVQFNAFLQGKVATQTLSGGNTDEFYRDEGTLPKSELLIKHHPDCARLVMKYGRWHHHVDYSSFKDNRLIKDPNVVIPTGINNYGMELVHTKPMDEYHHSCNRFNKIVEEPVKHSILEDFFV